MVPAHPPLPTPANLPFQFSSGSQTSNAICESLVGAMTPATRQNGGRLAIAFVEPGGVKEPVVIACAAAIVVFGSFCAPRPTQSGPDPLCAAASETVATSARTATPPISGVLVDRMSGTPVAYGGIVAQSVAGDCDPRPVEPRSRTLGATGGPWRRGRSYRRGLVLEQHAEETTRGRSCRIGCLRSFFGSDLHLFELEVSLMLVSVHQPVPGPA